MRVSLRAARVNSGLTLAEAALKIGVSKDTVRNWEIGKTYPDVMDMEKIMNLYSVRYDDIFFDFCNGITVTKNKDAK